MTNEHNQRSGISKRGFASMDGDKQREIASKGGQAAHAQGKAHEFSSEEARAAGRKGGEAAHARGTAHEFSPAERRAAGQKSGRHNRNAEGHGLRGAGAEQHPETEGQHKNS